MALTDILAERERFRDAYQERWDPICGDRLVWRAHTFRHMVHLLPGESVLEIGGGRGRFTRQLEAVCGGRNPLTVAVFSDPPETPGGTRATRILRVRDFPGDISGAPFDCVVGMEMLDRRGAEELLSTTFRHLLKPAGRVVFHESNPRNPVLQLRRILTRAGRSDPRRLMSAADIVRTMKGVGFDDAMGVPSDFVYWPLTRRMAWVLRNLSVLLENTAGIRHMAGSLLVYGRKPGALAARADASLCVHDALRQCVSVVVPCHNEEANVGPLVNGLMSLYGGYLRDIVLVDDNSTDATWDRMGDLARRWNIVRPIRRTPPAGVGLALRDGYRAVSGDWVLSIDCDFQHLLPEFQDIFDAAARGSDVVIGSRFSMHSVLLRYPFAKIVANRVFHVLAACLLGCRVRDATNNLKLMRRSVVDRLVLREPGFAVNAETGLEPFLMGVRVTEVPISWINRDARMGRSSFRLLGMGPGYARVLAGLRRLRAGRSTGPYRELPRRDVHAPP